MISMFDSDEDIIYTMANGNTGSACILCDMIDDSKDKIFVLDNLDISGNKIWKLFKDSCDSNYGKFLRTIVAFRKNAYSKKEINDILDLEKPVPFLNEDVIIDGIGDYNSYFDDRDDKWPEYIKRNRNVTLANFGKRKKYEDKVKTYTL